VFTYGYTPFTGGEAMFRGEHATEHCKEKAEFPDNCGTDREDCYLEPFAGGTEDITIPYSTG
jgi:hypothetical protein